MAPAGRVRLVMGWGRLAVAEAVTVPQAGEGYSGRAVSSTWTYKQYVPQESA